MKSEIKYAPTTLSEVIYPSKAIESRIQAYASGLLESHIILYGPNGTGKSTIARLLPDAIVDGSAIIESNDYESLFSQKDLKSYLKQLCINTRLFSEQSKVFLVFEEFDNAKFNMNKLWTAMDACNGDLQVIITTNHEMKIDKSFRSRCDQINISKLTARHVLRRAQFILNSEGLSLNDDYVLAYLQQVDWLGDLRLYMRRLDELIASHSMGLPLPAMNTRCCANQPSFKLVSGSKTIS